MTTSDSNTPQSDPSNPDNPVTRRYLTDAEYTRDARTMATAGWRASAITREPSNAIVVTYVFEASTPSRSSIAATPAELASTHPEPQMEPQHVVSPMVDVARLFPGGAKLLLALWAIYLLNIWLLFLGLGVRPAYAATYCGVALIVLVAECVGLLVWDGRNVVALFGALDWRRLPWWERIFGVVFFVAFPTYYLLLATVRHFRAVGKTRGAYLRQLAHNLRVSSGLAKVGLAAVALALVIVFCSSTALVGALAPALPQSAHAPQSLANRPLTSSGAPVITAPTQTTQAAAPTALPTATPTPTATATPEPTATSVPPTPTPTPRPTATPRPPAPTPTPKPTGVNGNPWSYNFSCCNYIYSPPSNFCSYFNCIPSFWKSTNGYVEECSDGTYSHSGGRSGSCSYHGGNWRALLQP